MNKNIKIEKFNRYVPVFSEKERKEIPRDDPYNSCYGVLRGIRISDKNEIKITYKDSEKKCKN